MFSHRALLSIGIAVSCLAASAEETKTTYSLTGSNATVITEVKKASADKEKLMRSYLFEAVAKQLKEFPMVTGVEFNKQVKGETTTASYQDYWETKRTYPAMIHLSLPTAVTMMVKVEESFRRCKSPAEKAAGQTTVGAGWDEGYDYSPGATVDCTLGSTVKIKGPDAVYGNFASSVEVENLLRNKQTLSFELSRDWLDKTTMKLESRFTIESELFDRNLIKFLSAFNLKIADAGQILTRNNILLGIARVLRVNNERVVE